MRTIKFRAWVEEYKTMLPVNSLRSICVNSERLTEEEFDGLIIMQFTGLLDKNGKEIFEGDIVAAWSAGSKGIFEIKWRQNGSPCYILYPAWQNGDIWHISATEYKKGKQFIDVDGNITTSEIDAFVDDGLEIIGNIYESPELLNQSK